MMLTRAQTRKSEQPADGPFGADPIVRPPINAAERPESSPAEPAGPVPVPATDWFGNDGPEGLSRAGVSLGCPGGQIGHILSVEATQRPPSEYGTFPLPGLATDNAGHHTASSGSDEAATGRLDDALQTLEFAHQTQQYTTH